MPLDVDQIFAEWNGALRGYVARRLRDPHAVADVVQESWIRIHRGLPTLRDEARMAPWIFRIARSALVDHVRKRRTSAGGDAVLDETVVEDDMAPDTEAELARCLPAFLRGLSAEDQSVLQAVDAGGQSQADFAREHGLSAPTVRSRTQRARQRLRRRIEQCCHVVLDRRGNPHEIRRKDGPSTDCGACA